MTINELQCQLWHTSWSSLCVKGTEHSLDVQKYPIFCHYKRVSATATGDHTPFASDCLWGCCMLRLSASLFWSATNRPFCQGGVTASGSCMTCGFRIKMAHVRSSDGVLRSSFSFANISNTVYNIRITKVKEIALHYIFACIIIYTLQQHMQSAQKQTKSSLVR